MTETLPAYILISSPNAAERERIIKGSAQRCEGKGQLEVHLGKVTLVSQHLDDLESGGTVQACADLIHEEDILWAAHHLACTQVEGLSSAGLFEVNLSSILVAWGS